jgi:hypothetical protein
LVTRSLGEPEEWVALDGTVRFRDEGAIELAERLAARYWDLADQSKAATLQSWRDKAGSLLVLELIPSQIRSFV